MNGVLGPRRKQVNRVTLWLGLEELPHCAYPHELLGLALHLFHLFEQFHRFGIMRGELLFEIAAKTQMPAVEHVWIDVAPNFLKVRNEAHLAFQVRRRWNRQITADPRRPRPRF